MLGVSIHTHSKRAQCHVILGKQCKTFSSWNCGNLFVAYPRRFECYWKDLLCVLSPRIQNVWLMEKQKKNTRISARKYNCVHIASHAQSSCVFIFFLSIIFPTKMWEDTNKTHCVFFVQKQKTKNRNEIYTTHFAM